MLADRLSRIQSPSELRHHPELRRLAEEWFPITTTTGCFASPVCRQPHLQYHSRYADPSAAKIDTCTTVWSHDVCWLAPPLSQIGSTIRKARQDRCTGILLHPVWPAAPWWAQLQFMTVDSMLAPDFPSHAQRLPTSPSTSQRTGGRQARRPGNNPAIEMKSAKRGRSTGKDGGIKFKRKRVCAYPGLQF